MLPLYYTFRNNTRNGKNLEKNPRICADYIQRETEASLRSGESKGQACSDTNANRGTNHSTGNASEAST